MGMSHDAASYPSSSQGSSFVLASTQELHEKISQLANRVRQLEDALRSSHSQLSNDPHPLLTEELLKIKAPLQREPPALRNGGTFPVKEEETNPDVIDAFGSLSINLSGKSRYYGHIANSWVSIRVPRSPCCLIRFLVLPSSKLLIRFSSVFPDISLSVQIEE